MCNIFKLLISHSFSGSIFFLYTHITYIYTIYNYIYVYMPDTNVKYRIQNFQLTICTKWTTWISEVLIFVLSSMDDIYPLFPILDAPKEIETPEVPSFSPTMYRRLEALPIYFTGSLMVYLYFVATFRDVKCGYSQWFLQGSAWTILVWY